MLTMTIFITQVAQYYSAIWLNFSPLFTSNHSFVHDLLSIRYMTHRISVTKLLHKPKKTPPIKQSAVLKIIL